MFDFEQAFQSLQVLLVEDNCAVSVSLEVNTDVVVFCLLVEVFDSSGGEERLHSEVLLEVFGGRIVGVVGLYKADCWIGWDIQVNGIVCIQSLRLLLQFLRDPLEKFSQNSSSPISIDKVQLSFRLSAK